MYFDKCRQSVNRIQNEEEIFTRSTFMPSRITRFDFFLFNNEIRTNIQYFVQASCEVVQITSMAIDVLNNEVMSDKHINK